MRDAALRQTVLAKIEFTREQSQRLLEGSLQSACREQVVLALRDVDEAVAWLIRTAQPGPQTYRIVDLLLQLAGCRLAFVDAHTARPRIADS